MIRRVAKMDPLLGMLAIAENRLPCGVCRGSGRSKYKLPAGSHAASCDGQVNPRTNLCSCEGIGERTCESCFGTLYEACSPDLRGKMYAEIAQYIHAKRRAVEELELQGARPSWVIVVKDEKRIEPAGQVITLPPAKDVQ